MSDELNYVGLGVILWILIWFVLLKVIEYQSGKSTTSVAEVAERIQRESHDLIEEPRQQAYYPQARSKTQYLGDTKTNRLYPRKLVGANGSETKRVRLYVQRDYQGSALYAKCLENWSDMTPRGVLADWLEERGFAGTASNLRESK